MGGLQKQSGVVGAKHEALRQPGLRPGDTGQDFVYPQNSIAVAVQVFSEQEKQIPFVDGQHELGGPVAECQGRVAGVDLVRLDRPRPGRHQRHDDECVPKTLHSYAPSPPARERMQTAIERPATWGR